MISTSFITGTGFIKCIPITWSGREVTAAIFVMEMEEVLVARMQFEGACSSICLKMFSLRSMFSVAASITSSAFETPEARDVLVIIFFNAFSFVSRLMLPLLTCLSKFF